MPSNTSEITGQNLRSKSTEEKINIPRNLSSFEQLEIFFSKGKTRHHKTKSSIYDLVEEFKAPYNDRTDLEIISGFSRSSWWSECRNSDETSILDRTNIKNQATSKKNPEGDAIRRLSKNVVPSDKIKTHVDQIVAGRIQAPSGDDVSWSRIPPPLDHWIPAAMEVPTINGKTAAAEAGVGTGSTGSPSSKGSPGAGGRRLVRTNAQKYQMLLDKRREEIQSLQESMQFQNQEMASLREQLRSYQEQISGMKSVLTTTKREMTELGRILHVEKIMSNDLKRANEAKLTMIKDLTERLSTEQAKSRSLMESERKLRYSRDELRELLSAEKNERENLEKRLDAKGSQIEELKAQLSAISEQMEECKRQSMGVIESGREGSRLEEPMREERNEFSRMRQDHSALQRRMTGQFAELQGKNEVIKELQQQVDDLKTANRTLDEAAINLVEKQQTLVSINEELVGANKRLSEDKVMVQKTMSKLESTHRGVLVDLKRMLGIFKRQLVVKYKESDDLRRRLKRKEILLSELIAERELTASQADPFGEGRFLRSLRGQRNLWETALQRNTLSGLKKKRRNRKRDGDFFLQLGDFIPKQLSYRNSGSNLRALTDFRIPRSLQIPPWQSDRGDTSSLGGFESSHTTSTCQSSKKFEMMAPILKRPACFHTTLKPLSEHSKFLKHVNHLEMGKFGNLYSPFVNISPALINLGLSHLIGQMEHLQKVSSRYFTGDIGKVSPKNLDRIQRSSSYRRDSMSTPAIAISESKSIDVAMKSSAWAREGDESVFELVSLLCSSFYKAVSRIISKNYVRKR